VNSAKATARDAKGFTGQQPRRLRLVPSHHVRRADQQRLPSDLVVAGQAQPQVAEKQQVGDKTAAFISVNHRLPGWKECLYSIANDFALNPTLFRRRLNFSGMHLHPEQ
jgi:hypothetical protein